MNYRLLLLSTVFAYSASAKSDTTLVPRDSLKNSLLVQPASTHTFSQVIRRENFNAGLFADPLQLIQGKTMGLWMVQPNGDPSQRLETYSPGFSSAARNLSPMIIVDGVPNRPLSSVHPQDIDSIVVLRDATALRAYGSRGLNGVLLIATRRPTTALLSASYLVQTAVESPARYQNLLSAAQWRQYVPGTSAFYPESDGGGDTDWQKLVARTVLNTNHLITVGSTFRNGDIGAAIGYLDRTGTLEKTGIGRLTSRLDGTYGFWRNRIKLTGSVWYANSREQPLVPDLADAIQQANPTISSTVRTRLIPRASVLFSSPLNIIDSVANETDVAYTGYRFAASVNPLPNLLISVQHATSGFDATQNTLDQRLTLVKPYLFDVTTEAERRYRIELANQVNAGINSYRSTVGTTDFTFQYNLPIKRSQINTWFNYTTNRIEDNYFVYGRTNTGYFVNQLTDGNPSFWSSFAAGLDYSLRSKFFLNLAYRKESYLASPIRSNRLGVIDKLPAAFPVVSLRWQPKSSLFLEYVWTKAEPLHASVIHLEGDQPFNLLSHRFRTVQLPAQELFFQQVGRVNWMLKGWNTTLEYIGSDKKTVGYMPNVAGQWPFSMVSYTVRQHGINLQTAGTVFNRPNLSVNTFIVAGFLRTLVIRSQGYSPLTDHAASEPYSPFISYVGYVMSFDAAGIAKREDTNGDGQTDIADQRRIGSVYPTVTLGWSTSFNWRRLRATMLWRGSLGGAVQTPAIRHFSFYNGYRDLKIGNRNYLDELVASQARAKPYSGVEEVFTQTNNLRLQSTDHLRLDNLSVTYELLFNKMPINIGVFAQNLLTITKFPGNDPERSAYALDYSNSSAFYPRPRVIGLSAQIAWQRPKK